jgi:hypothetical protein
MSDQSFEINGGQRITQHKRFVPYCTHLNFYFAKTSFMLETLSGMLCLRKTKRMGKKAPFGCKSVVALAKHWMVPIG